MDYVTLSDLTSLINTLADDMIAAKDTLNTLDGAIGDGDLGITMTIGFQVIKKQLAENRYEEMQTFFSDCSTAFADNAASTFGALMATMFLRAGRVVKSKTEMTTADVAAIFKSAAEGVQKRGGANLGDKTILDALIPAAEACEKSYLDGQPLTKCLESALSAARDGAERTITMKSNAGRSGWLGDRTVGQKDPGAAALVMILESVCKFNQISKQ